MNLPLCTYRHEQRHDGFYRCTSLRIPLDWVCGQFCATCPFASSHERQAATTLRQDGQPWRPTGQAVAAATPAATPKPRPIDCPHHGPNVVGENQRSATRGCSSCGGSLARQVVFLCTHPAKPMGEQVILADCSRCPQRPQ